MKIRLTEEQIKELAPLQELVVEASKAGHQGSIFVQIFPVENGYMNARFIPPDVTDKLVELLDRYWPVIKQANKRKR